MKKAGFVIGIISLVFAGIFIFLPGGALFATFLGVPLVALSVDRGAIMGWIAGGLNIANIIFFSPSMWLATGLGGLGVPIFYVVLQVIGMLIMFFWTKHLNGEKTPLSKILNK
jgi:hypothetical protein